MTQKFDFREYVKSAKSMLTRNYIIMVILNFANQYLNTFRNGYQSFIAKDLGMAATVIGVAATINMLAGLLSRSPSGSIINNLISKIKYIFAAAYIFRAILWLIYPFANSGVLYLIVYTIDGFLQGFIGTAIPALTALCIDKKVMGLGNAIVLVLNMPLKAVIALARPAGMAAYTDKGLMTATIYSIGIAVVVAILPLLFDNKALSFSIEEKMSKDGSVVKEKKKSGLLWSMMPLAIVAGMPLVLNGYDKNFMNIFATDNGLTEGYKWGSTIGSTASSIINAVAMVLIDITSPTLIVLILMVCQATSGVLWAMGGQAFAIGTGIYYATRTFNQILRVVGMKAISRSEYGSFSATMLLMQDAFTAVGSTITGVLIDAFGHTVTQNLLSVWVVIAIVGFIIFSRTGMKKLALAKEENEE